jgi:hypothetical protein
MNHYHHASDLSADLERARFPPTASNCVVLGFGSGYCFAQSEQLGIKLVRRRSNSFVMKCAHQAGWRVEYKPALAIDVFVDGNSNRNIEPGLNVLLHHRDGDHRITQRILDKAGGPPPASSTICRDRL